MLKEPLPTLGATLTSVVLLLLLGTALVSGSFRILPRFRAVDGSLRLFSCLLGGLAATVIAASLSFTTGNSVSVVLLGGTALAALAAATQPISPNVQRPAAPTAWPWVVGASIALCLWFGLHNTHVGEFQWQVPFRDTAHYAQVAAALAETGIETPLGAESRVPYRPLKPTPYHYFELWLSAVLARSWNSPTLPLVILTTPTLLALTLGVGFLALADAEGSKRSLRLWAVVALWLAPFLPGVALHTHLLREADVFTGWGSILGHAKLLPLYLCVVAALLFFDAGYQAAALTLVACCGVVNFTALPTSLVASAFALLAANKPQGRPARMAFMCPSVVLLGIVLFYTANAGGGGPWPHSRELVGSALDLTTLRTRVHIVAKTSIQLAAVYTPLLLLAGPRAVAQQVRRYGWFLGAVLTTGIAAWVVLDRWTNGVQFFANSAVVFLNVFVFAVYLRGKDSRRLLAIAGTLCLAATHLPGAAERFLAPLPYGEAFLKSLARIPGGVGGFTVSRNYLQHASPHERNLRVNAPEYLAFYNLGAIPLVCPSMEDAGVEPGLRSLIESTLSCQYLSRQLSTDSGGQRTPMVDHFRLGFVVTHGADAPLPETRQTLVLVSKDSVSGDAAYVVEATR